MIEHPQGQAEVESAARRIALLVAARGEWLYIEGEGKPTALRASECDARAEHGRLIFSCWSDEGARVWRVVSWEWTGEKLRLEATRRMGAEHAVLELIPRASAKAAAAVISATRRERCLRLAQLACAELPGASVERATLSAGARRSQPGRYARILLRHRTERIAVVATIAVDKTRSAEAFDKTPSAEAFLSSSLLWFARARERTMSPVIRQLWLIVEPELAQPVARHLALLRDDLRCVIRLFEIDEHWQTLTRVPRLERAQLWQAARGARFLRPAKEREPSDWATRISSLAPGAIDIVRAHHGETLRFHGLAFARVRRFVNHERAWLGIEGARRRLLDESNWHECLELLQELAVHRSAEAAEHHHALYKAAPEAWLESLLRRDITRLDPGLRLAPLHAQFRTGGDTGAGTRPVDLLALRRDGRLAVIELKVTEDREHVLQGVDYYRRIEAQRRRGHLERARLFGDAKIADSPPLVYLVAPLLRFHRAFNHLARAIAGDIELYRFDLNEDWRAGVRVVRRELVTR